MESAGSAMIAYLAEMVREEAFSPPTAAADDVRSFLPPSAYETAWVAMVPSARDPSRRPMFPNSLRWILQNQREEGFWGDSLHSLDSLTATLACVAALRTWNAGRASVEKGLQYLNANMEKILAQQHGGFPRWFTMVFPGMIELARGKGLEVIPTEGCAALMDDIFNARNTILETKEGSDGYAPPRAWFLESLPASCRPSHEEIVGQQMEDGSLFHSPSATACAFMLTGDRRFMGYLEGMTKTCRDMVPATFPVDQDLVKLCLVDHLGRLGCAEHFTEETRAIMDQIYSDWVLEPHAAFRVFDLSLHIQRSSLAFQLLRQHGYDVSPRKLCSFMENKELLEHIEENYAEFSVAMYSVYRAGRFMFSHEVELRDAGLFAQKILRKCLTESVDHDPATLAEFQEEIQHELGVPWLARMDHLEHRRYTERSRGYNLSLGKASSCRLLSPRFSTQLAAEVFRNRQLVYQSELEELKRWSRDTGLSSMGFGREKTAYCYFLTAAAVNLPLQDSDLRMITAQGSILVTVIDDFFDEEASLEDLQSLTEAVRRWEGEGLTGHSKVIFDAIDNLVSDVCAKALARHGHDVGNLLRDMWRETFDSWLTESSWSMKRHAPPVSDYLDNAKISIAIQVMSLPACCLLLPELPKGSLNSRYPRMTEMTMIASRLLNDIQSHEKEIQAGKFNMVPLFMKENGGARMEDSVEHIRGVIDASEKEFIEIYVTDAGLPAGISKEWKDLHLGTLKSFRMLFNSSNAFDSSTALLRSIGNAFYDPLDVAEEPTIQVADSPMKKNTRITLPRPGDKAGLLAKTAAAKDNERKPSRKLTLNIIKTASSPERHGASREGRWMKISRTPYLRWQASALLLPGLKLVHL